MALVRLAQEEADLLVHPLVQAATSPRAFGAAIRKAQMDRELAAGTGQIASWYHTHGLQHTRSYLQLVDARDSGARPGSALALLQLRSGIVVPFRQQLRRHADASRSGVERTLRGLYRACPVCSSAWTEGKSPETPYHSTYWDFAAHVLVHCTGLEEERSRLLIPATTRLQQACGPLPAGSKARVTILLGGAGSPTGGPDVPLGGSRADRWQRAWLQQPAGGGAGGGGADGERPHRVPSQMAPCALVASFLKQAFRTLEAKAREPFGKPTVPVSLVRKWEV